MSTQLHGVRCLLVLKGFSSAFGTACVKHFGQVVPRIISSRGGVKRDQAPPLVVGDVSIWDVSLDP